VLAAAVADFEDEALGCGKEGARIERALGERDFEAGQDIAIERILPAMKPLAGAAAKEGPWLAGKIQRVVGLWQTRPPSPRP
jgi:hypothetical protein